MLHHLQPEEPASSAQPINLFFALKPDPEAAKQAHAIAVRHRAARQMSGWPLAMNRLHVTLVSVGGFFGAVPDEFMQLALSVGDAVAMSPFDVRLDRALSFPRKTGKRPYVLLGGEDVAGMMPLHCSLVGAMFRMGLDIPMRASFSPHMTLLYDSTHQQETPVVSISWTAREFVLIESHVGLTRHIERGRWRMR